MKSVLPFTEERTEGIFRHFETVFLQGCDFFVKVAYYIRIVFCEPFHLTSRIYNIIREDRDEKSSIIQ